MKLSKYQQTALRILAIPEGVYEVDMGAFSKEYGDPKFSLKCGTTYCIAGILAHEDEYPSEFVEYDVFDYSEYSSSLVDYKVTSDYWAYLFDEEHPNSLESAKERALYALINDSYEVTSESSK